MRSFTIAFAAAALAASPLVSARMIQVDSEYLASLRDGIDSVIRNGGASSSSSSSVPTFDPNARSVVVPTEGDDIAMGGGDPNARSVVVPTEGDDIAMGRGDPNARSVVVPTEEDTLANAGGPTGEFPVVDTLGQSQAPGTFTGEGSCTNADPQCNRFTHFTHCWQVCLASQKTKNPIGRGADGKAPNCARWCENSCGCDPSMDPSATTGSAFPSDAASLSMTQRTRMSQSQGRGQPRTFTQEQNFPAV